MSADNYSPLFVEAIVKRLQERWGHLTRGDLSTRDGSATDYSHKMYMDALVPDLVEYAAKRVKEREVLDE